MLKRLNTQHRSYGGDPTGCSDKSCPIVYEVTHAPGTVRVQGLRVTDVRGQENFDPATESAVDIPTAVLLEAARKLESKA